jgi:HEPN domain-containing protein
MRALPSEQDTREGVVATLEERLGGRLLAVVLFGSRVRRTARPESDWDVLVVATDLPDTLADRARLLARGSTPPAVRGIAALLHSPEEFTHGLASVYLDIALDGQILYDPQGIAARRLASVRKLIRSEGLYREETPAGDMWTWRKPPAPWLAWRKRVHLTDGPQYRLSLAQTSLAEAQEDASIRRWRSCVDNSQLAAENAAKEVLALLGPIGRTHDPGALLHRALAEHRFPEALADKVERLAGCAERLGPEVHALVRYGDEAALRTPWEIFDEERARELLGAAEEAVRLASALVETG